VKTLDAKFSVTQSTVVESLGHDKLVPKYTHWTPIQRNYKVDDDPVLRHLPYFGDEDNFDYLSYYDSNSLLDDDKEGQRSFFSFLFHFPFLFSFFSFSFPQVILVSPYLFFYYVFVSSPVSSPMCISSFSFLFFPFSFSFLWLLSFFFSFSSIGVTAQPIGK